MYLASGSLLGDSISQFVAEFVVIGDMLRASMLRGRAPANTLDVLAMFRLVYSGEGATEPLVEDFSQVNVFMRISKNTLPPDSPENRLLDLRQQPCRRLTKDQNWQLLFDRNRRNLAPRAKPSGSSISESGR